ncbi:MAG TPA: protein kinase [Polyangiaceae bacterium]|nr:protein kinase [Polyangiaceae bacterium]
MDPGFVVSERFRIEHRASVGGTAKVYRATDLQTGATVALKVLYGEVAEEQTERLEREAELLAQLSHPGIVRLVAHGELEAGTAYLALEWVEGETLGQRLARTGLTMRESVDLVRRTAEILAYAHGLGVVHRDIKPANLILRDKELERVVVIDLGIAKGGGGSQPASITQVGAVLGTLGYMAPEQARGVGRVDARTDVFALGALLYKCLTGVPPFDADDPIAVLGKLLYHSAPRVRDARANVPQELDDLIARMLSQSPDDRPADAGVVAAELAALRDLEGDRTVLAHPTKGEAIMHGEQRLVSVIAIATAEGVDEPTLVDGPSAASPSLARRLRLAVAPFGAQLEALPSGELLATLAGRASATDQAVRAARCAFAIRLAAPRVPLVLVTGRAVLAERVPMGDAVDRALELLRCEPDASPAAPGARPILVDEISAGLLDARFVVSREAGALHLQRERAPQDAARLLLGKPTTCVSRERELLEVEGVFAECVADEVARAVLVKGAAGVGKSRVRYETLRAIKSRTEGVEVWLASGDPMRARSPFGMLAQMVRGAAGVLDGEPIAVQREKLRARVARHVPRAGVPRVAQFLAELIGAAGGERDDVQLRAARSDAQLMGDQIARAWEEFLSAEAAVHPVVLVLEDLHWGDLPSVNLMGASLRIKDRPILVLALARPEIDNLYSDLWAEHSPREVRLGELSRKASERLVRQVLDDLADDATVARIVATAGGNAFYLEELIRSVAEGHGDRLPGSVIAMAQGRIEALEPEARRVLRAASVFGKTFWTSGVVALFDDRTPVAEIAPWLTELGDREILTRQDSGRFRGEQEWTFRHGLLAEAAYAMLTERDRRSAHQRAGEWLESVGEGDPVTLATHFEAGDEPKRAVVFWRRAAAQALEGSDLEAVLHYADRGIACGGDGEVRGRLLLRKAEARRWRGEYAEAERHAREAMALLGRKSVRHFRALAEAVEAASALGDEPRLRELVSLLSQRSQNGVRTAAHVVALSRAAVALLQSGDYRSADGLLTYVDDASGPPTLSDPNASGTVHSARAYRALVHGDTALALSLYDATIERFQEAGNVRGAARALVDSGAVCVEMGEWEDAERLLTDALATGERLGLGVVTAPAHQIRGLVRARAGQFDEAIAAETLAVRAFAAQGDRRMEAASRVIAARIWLAAGHLAEAEREVRQALARPELAPHVTVYGLAVLAGVLLARGEADEAREPIDEAMLVLDGLGGVEAGESFVRLTYAEVLYASGDEARARRAIAAARARLLARADLMSSPQWRASFLEAVEENARTLALAEAWGHA